MSRTAGELAQYLGARVEGNMRAPISGVASPERAGGDDLIYLESQKHHERAAKSTAICVLAPPGTQLEGKTVIATDKPKLAFAKAAAWLLPKRDVKAEIHPTVVVGANVSMGANVSVGPYVVIEDEVTIGDGSVVDAFCFLGRASRVGQDCRLHPRVTIYAGATLGDRVEVHSGTVIGGDGFGYVFGEGRHWKFPQIGTVTVGDDVEIGCNTAIDRGSLDETRIGKDVKIDNLVQVAHNVRIGDHSVVAAQTGISGSSVLGKQVMVGGQAGIGDHSVIEDRANIGGQAGVLVRKTIRAGQTVWGTPARPLEKFKEQYAWFARLPELAERVRRLEGKSGK